MKFWQKISLNEIRNLLQPLGIYVSYINEYYPEGWRLSTADGHKVGLTKSNVSDDASIVWKYIDDLVDDMLNRELHMFIDICVWKPLFYNPWCGCNSLEEMIIRRDLVATS